MTYHHRLMIGTMGFVLGGMWVLATARADDDSIVRRTPAKLDSPRAARAAARGTSARSTDRPPAGRQVGRGQSAAGPAGR